MTRWSPRSSLDTGHCPDPWPRRTCWPRPRAPAHRPAPATPGSAVPAWDTPPADGRVGDRAATRHSGRRSAQAVAWAALDLAERRRPLRGSRPWPPPCWGPGSRWPSDGPPAPPPPRNAGRWPPGTAAASSPGARSPPRPARPTTSQDWADNGNTDLPEPGPALLGTSPPSRPRHVDHRPDDRPPIRCPDPNPEHHPEPPGPPTTTHPGPSPAPPEPAGGCDGGVTHPTLHRFTR